MNYEITTKKYGNWYTVTTQAQFEKKGINNHATNLELGINIGWRSTPKYIRKKMLSDFNMESPARIDERNRRFFQNKNYLAETTCIIHANQF